MNSYDVYFRTDGEGAFTSIDAKTPRAALRKAIRFFKQGKAAKELVFEPHDGQPINEIHIYDHDGAACAFWQDKELRLRVAAPDLLKACRDDDLDKAHDRLSDLLEDEDAGNDDIRDAAIDLCACLCDHYEKRRRAIAKAKAGAS